MFDGIGGRWGEIWSFGVVDTEFFSAYVYAVVAIGEKEQ